MFPMRAGCGERRRQTHASASILKGPSWGASPCQNEKESLQSRGGGTGWPRFTLRAILPGAGAGNGMPLTCHELCLKMANDP